MYKSMWLQFFTLSLAEDIFRQNIGEQMEIGVAEEGYKKTQLHCSSDSMVVSLELTHEFLGVIYTRGSFYDKKPPCFYDTGNIRGEKYFKFKFRFDECKTKQIGDLYSNVLIVQHDKELIMPGDVAFKLECDFNKLQDITVEADMLSESSILSRITLTDADPSSKSSDKSGKFVMENRTNTVQISPESLKRKEEL